MFHIVYLKQQQQQQKINRTIQKFTIKYRRIKQNRKIFSYRLCVLILRITISLDNVSKYSPFSKIKLKFQFYTQ